MIEKKNCIVCDNEIIIVNCHYTCKTCFGNSFDNCLSCSSDHILDEITHICKCASGYYLNNNGDCI